MLNGPCQWPDCSRPSYARGLCERCNMRARRAGTLLSFTSPDATCRFCGTLFAEGSRSGKWFCSTGCQKDDLRRRRALRRVERVGERTCASCYEPVPIQRRSDARHCSVNCQQSDWYEANGDHARARQRKWAGSHRELRNEYQHRRESRKRGIPNEPIQLALVWERDAGMCWICSRPVDLDAKFPAPLSRSLDHVIPLAKGGTHTFGNVATAHLRCNISKKDKLLAYLPGWFDDERGEESDALAAKPA